MRLVEVAAEYPTRSSFPFKGMEDLLNISAVNFHNLSKIEKEKAAKVVKDYIHKNCQPWLTQSGNEPGWRGVNLISKNVVPPLVFNRRPRKNRKPLDTDPNISNLFDKIIASLGSKALRKNSFFIGDELNASNYGTLYGFFPIGDFHYTWLDGVQDFYKKYADPIDSYSFYNEWDLDDVSEKVREDIKKRIMIDKGLKKALLSDYEILINAKRALHVYHEMAPLLY